MTRLWKSKLCSTVSPLYPMSMGSEFADSTNLELKILFKKKFQKVAKSKILLPICPMPITMLKPRE